MAIVVLINMISASKAAIHSHLILESLAEQEPVQSLAGIRAESHRRLKCAVDNITILLIDFLQAKVISFLPVAA